MEKRANGKIMCQKRKGLDRGERGQTNANGFADVVTPARRGERGETNGRVNKIECPGRVDCLGGG